MVALSPEKVVAGKYGGDGRVEFEGLIVMEV